jgi:hypothetical protein
LIGGIHGADGDTLDAAIEQSFQDTALFFGRTAGRAVEFVADVEFFGSLLHAAFANRPEFVRVVADEGQKRL